MVEASSWPSSASSWPSSCSCTWRWLPREAPGGRLSRRGRLRPAEGAYAAGAYGAGAYGAGAYGAGGSDRAGDGVPCIDTVVGRQGGQVHGPGGIAERTV